jgi:hypothetical protein
MDDFDARNHIRDMHRYADQRRLAQLAQQGAAVNYMPRMTRLVLVGSGILVLVLAFMR